MTPPTPHLRNFSENSPVLVAVCFPSFDIFHLPMNNFQSVPCLSKCAMFEEWMRIILQFLIGHTNTQIHTTTQKHRNTQIHVCIKHKYNFRKEQLSKCSMFEEWRRTIWAHKMLSKIRHICHSVTLSHPSLCCILVSQMCHTQQYVSLNYVTLFPTHVREFLVGLESVVE